MKKLPILWLIAALLIGCKPSIDSQLDKLEKQYASGDEEASAATWSKLWERQNEMSMVQVARFVKLTEANDPEWHYDEVDDDSGVTAVGVYMESRAEAAPRVAPQSASAGYSGAPQLSYYECASCGLVVKSADYPARANGICYHRDGRTSHHMWAFIEKVGTEHIFSCRKCGLQLQTDKCPSINKGTCRDGRRHDWQHDY